MSPSVTTRERRSDLRNKSGGDGTRTHEPPDCQTPSDREVAAGARGFHEVTWGFAGARERSCGFRVVMRCGVTLTKALTKAKCAAVRALEDASVRCSAMPANRFSERLATAPTSSRMLRLNSGTDWGRSNQNLHGCPALGALDGYSRKTLLGQPPPQCYLRWSALSGDRQNLFGEVGAECEGR